MITPPRAIILSARAENTTPDSAVAYGGVYFVWLPELGHTRHHVNFLVGCYRGLQKPGFHGWSAIVAASSAGQALMSAFWTEHMSSVETVQMASVETGASSRQATRGANLRSTSASLIVMLLWLKSCWSLSGIIHLMKC